jgi:nucleoside-diphosphate-sugar epimerase
MKGSSENRVAILGATGHIAKGLIYNFCQSAPGNVVLFARSANRVSDFLKAIHCDKNFDIRPLEGFVKSTYDVVINCIGIGQPAKLKAAAATVFRLTETYDNMILDYLSSQPETLYINFSSGAVYGTAFSEPAGEGTKSVIDVNHIDRNDFYRIAKINSEAKHRSFSDFNIVDLRIFAYFSRFIDLQAKYFITEIISCIQQDQVFETGPEDMVRDYVHPIDLFSLIERCIEKKRMNTGYDVYGRKPCSKFEILEYFSKEFGLKYLVKNDFVQAPVTGSKNIYCSMNRKAEEIGYLPQFTSLDTLSQESKFLLQ